MSEQLVELTCQLTVLFSNKNKVISYHHDTPSEKVSKHPITQLY